MYLGCLAAFTGTSNNLVFDYILGPQEQLVSLLAPFDVFYLALHCAVMELDRCEGRSRDCWIADAR